MTYDSYRNQDHQTRQYYRLGMQGGWTQGAKWTVRFLWILGIAWVAAVIGIYAVSRFTETVPRFIESLYLNPAAVLPWLSSKSGLSQPWQVLTAPWVPSASLCGLVGLFHLMYLLVFGPRLEREWGSRKFLRFFLTTAYVATVLALLLRGVSPWLQASPASTASAAIFGLMVAYGLMWPRDPLYVFGLFPLPVFYIVLGLCGLEVLCSIVYGANALVDYVADVSAIVLAYAAFKVPIFRAIMMGSPGGRTKSRRPIRPMPAVGPLEVTPDRKPSTASKSGKNDEKDRTKFLEL